MIEFTLSKMNLLIFVTAVASIVIFFMATVNSNMKTRQSYELVYKIGSEINSGIKGKSYCTVKQIDIPNVISTNTGGSGAFTIKYYLDISYYQVSDDINKIVLSIIDRRERNNTIYAAYDIDFDGPVHLFSSDCDNSQEAICKVDDPFVAYDPLKARSIDTKIFFAKKIKNGKPNIYFFPCAYRDGQYKCNVNGELKDLIYFEENVDCLENVLGLIDLE